MSTSRETPAFEAVSGEQFGASAVLDRMKEAWSVDTDSALAKWLHTTRQTLSKWRTRNSVPYTEAVFTSFRQVSLDWLLKGEQEAEPKIVKEPEINQNLIRALVVGLVGMQIIKLREPEGLDQIELIARAISKGYQRAQQTKQLMMQQDHMTEEDALRVAIAATELLSSDGSNFGARLTPEARGGRG